VALRAKKEPSDRDPLLLLHLAQQLTRLSNAIGSPPWMIGMTWSTVVAGCMQ
jgi:hypothetical protein